jgi:hypothetical protein
MGIQERIIQLKIVATVRRTGMTRETLSAVADAVIVLTGIIAVLEAIHRLI